VSATLCEDILCGQTAIGYSMHHQEMLIKSMRTGNEFAKGDMDGVGQLQRSYQ
jgi:hypothetical protein